MNLLEIEKRIIELNDENERRTKEYKAFYENHKNKIQELEEGKKLLLKDLNADKINIAKNILYLYMPRRAYSDLIYLAIKDLASGCNLMKHKYFGAKDYNRWSGQREDHEYGYGPKHGNTVFALGLKQPNRKLTDHEIECCLYYLGNFFTIHDNIPCEKTN